MPKKGENIRKRKDGRWEGRYKSGIKDNGKIYYRSVYGKTYKEVKEKLLTAKQNISAVTAPKNTEKRFREVLDLWKETNRIRLKGGTEARYSYLIEVHINPCIGDLKLSEITSTKINAFLLNKLKNGRLDGNGGLSASYVTSIMTIVKSAIQFAVDEQMCFALKTPILRPPTKKDELVILSMDEQRRLEKYSVTNLNPTKVGVLISLYTGLRIGEICALKWSDIDLSEQILHVRHTVARVKNQEPGAACKTSLIIDTPKTKASKRDVPFPSSLLPIISELKENATSPFVVSDKKQFISPRTFEYRYHRILDLCEIRSINFHALRHTFATRCIEAGVDIKSLSEILGHANVSITLNTYVHSSMTMKKAQIEKLSVLNI